MKSILTFGISCIILLFTSCKKESTSANKCYVSVANIAGFYKIKSVTKGGVDVTSVFLTSCQQGAQFELYADKTFVYNELVPTCTGSGFGNWSLDLTNNTLTINSTGNPIVITNAKISSWDCTTMVIKVTASGSEYTVTIEKTHDL